MVRMMIEQSVISSELAKKPGRHPVNQKNDMAALIRMLARGDRWRRGQPHIPVLMTS